jgi:hypothetical protein
MDGLDGMDACFDKSPYEYGAIRKFTEYVSNLSDVSKSGLRPQSTLRTNLEKRGGGWRGRLNHSELREIRGPGRMPAPQDAVEYFKN